MSCLARAGWRMAKRSAGRWPARSPRNNTRNVAGDWSAARRVGANTDSNAQRSRGSLVVAFILGVYGDRRELPRLRQTLPYEFKSCWLAIVQGLASSLTNEA